MEFSRQEYWNGFSFPPLGHLPDTRIEPTSPASPALADRFFTTEPAWNSQANSRKASKPHYLLFFKVFFFFFDVDHFWNLYWICYNIASVLCFVFFGTQACRILAPWPVIKPTCPVLTSGQPRKSHVYLATCGFPCVSSNASGSRGATPLSFEKH